MSASVEERRAAEMAAFDALPDWQRRLVWEHGLLAVIWARREARGSPERMFGFLEERRRQRQQELIAMCCAPPAQQEKGEP